MSNYSSIEGVATCTKYDQDERAFVFTNDEGKIFKVKKGNNIKGQKLSFGSKYKMKLGKAASGNIYFLNEFVCVGGKRNTSNYNGGGSNSGGDRKYDSEGQSHGNYRTCLADFITALLVSGKEITDEIILEFNKNLKLGHKDFFEVKPEEAAGASKETGVVDEIPPAEVPQESQDSPF